MKEPSTWIKLDRNILQWRWYSDANTFRVFIHLLLNANIADHDFRTETIHRGELATSMGHIAESLGISYRNVRTSLMHLESTQEVTITRRSKYIVISIPNYDKYQSGGRQLTGKWQATDRQVTTIKEVKKERSKESLSLSLSHKPYHIPTLEEVIEYERANGLGKNAEQFYKYYSKEGWKANGKKIYSWTKLYDNWEEPEEEEKEAYEHPRYVDEDGFVYEWDYEQGRYEIVERPKKTRTER